ncbi:MAG: CPBP family intramembrane glutamic endopeptidase [bacterium]
MNSNPVGAQTLFRLFAYFGGVLLLACLLSPPLYWTGTWLAELGILPVVKGFPFHRYFSRCVQISAILLLWPAFRVIGVRRLSDLGLQSNRAWARDLLGGFLLALIPVALLGLGYVLTGVYTLKTGFNFSGCLRIFGTASVVSIIEEFLFRGVLLGLAVAAMPRQFAAILSAVCFALVHFMRTSRFPVDMPVGWLSGFEQLPQAFSSAPPWPLFGWGFLSLLVAGLLLAYAALRTKSLFLPIGLHAGWILSQQSLQLVAQFTPKPPDAFLPWVGPNVVSGAVPTGIAPVFVLLATCVFVWLFLRHASRRS